MPTQRDPASPPSYCSPAVDKETADATERAWARFARNSDLCVCRNRCTKNACCKMPQVILGFQSTEHRPQSTGLARLLGRRQAPPAWRAIFFIHNRNVASLMRRGPSFSLDDLLPGTDTIALNRLGKLPTELPPHIEARDKRTMLTRQFAPSWGESRGSWPHYRAYILAENGHRHMISPVHLTQPPTWLGHLFVFSHDASIITNFDIQAITSQTSVWGWALDTKGGTVFDTRGGPAESFNTVFPHLYHWWSCPGDHPSSATERQREGQDKG
ncbi:hypothetical protein LIA77_08934 [Sarocladium implicatum]|nr:hypothetical protein LIA77_08934 [Sarocladium implicatum]